jgi:hypothetical protein
MSALVARALEHVHGHLGWLTALALAHPAILLRRRRRRALGVAAAATALATATATLGALLYPQYRAVIKPLLFAASPAVGELFERKEHLGVGALVLAWVGLGAHALSRRYDSAAAHDELGRLAFIAYAAAAILATTTATLGVVVAVHRSW